MEYYKSPEKQILLTLVHQSLKCSVYILLPTATLQPLTQIQQILESRKAALRCYATLYSSGVLTQQTLLCCATLHVSDVLHIDVKPCQNQLPHIDRINGMVLR